MTTFTAHVPPVTFTPKELADLAGEFAEENLTADVHAVDDGGWVREITFTRDTATVKRLVGGHLRSNSGFTFSEITP